MIPEPKLKDLYQELILDHNRNPRNFQKLDDATHYSHGYNPLCGDDYHLYLKVKDGTIERIGFQGNGCAISKSSASLLTALLKDKSTAEAEDLRKNFIEMMTAADADMEALKKKVGKMMIFEGVKDFPIRVKCATLIWHALADALTEPGEKGS